MDNNDLEENQDFWQVLFQQTNLTLLLMEDEEMNDITKQFEFNLDDVPYGKTSVTAKAAVPIGSNFMSDVFIVTGIDEKSNQYSGFVKV